MQGLPIDEATDASASMDGAAEPLPDMMDCANQERLEQQKWELFSKKWEMQSVPHTLPLLRNGIAVCAYKRRASMRARRRRQCTSCRCLLWWVEGQLVPRGQEADVHQAHQKCDGDTPAPFQVRPWITTTRDPQSLPPLA